MEAGFSPFVGCGSVHISCHVFSSSLLEDCRRFKNHASAWTAQVLPQCDVMLSELEI